MVWRVMGIALAVSIGTGILFGLIPALHGSRTALSETLKESGGRSGSSFRHNKSRSMLVVAEMALALVLLVGTALLIRTSLALGAVQPGFDASNVLTMRMSLSGSRFLESAGVEQMVRNDRERIEAIRRRARHRHVLHSARRWLRTSFKSSASPPPTIRGTAVVEGRPCRRGSNSKGQDSGDEGPHVQRSRHRRRPAGCIQHEGVAITFWKDGDPLRDRS